MYIVASVSAYNRVLSFLLQVYMRMKLYTIFVSLDRRPALDAIIAIVGCPLRYDSLIKVYIYIYISDTRPLRFQSANLAQRNLLSGLVLLFSAGPCRWN